VAKAGSVNPIQQVVKDFWKGCAQDSLVKVGNARRRSYMAGRTEVREWPA
jgi:hypothetical protein